MDYREMRNTLKFQQKVALKTEQCYNANMTGSKKKEVNVWVKTAEC